MPTTHESLDLMRLAAELAIEGGALVRRYAARHEPWAFETKSSAVDLVTEADRTIEARLVERLLAARPHDGVVGEEGAARTGTSGVRWLLDPIDGTTNFVYGVPAYAVSVAAEVGGERVAGAVHDAARNETFSAAAGHGAFLDGLPIRVSGKQDLATALVGTGFSYLAERRRRQAEVLVRVLPDVRDIRRLGSAAIDLCWVACGRLDAYYESGLQPWDLAAGEVIVREAGGATGSFDGEPVTSGALLAATPALFEPLRDLLRQAGAR